MYVCCAFLNSWINNREILHGESEVHIGCIDHMLAIYTELRSIKKLNFIS